MVMMVAVDLGAQSGRIGLGRFSGRVLTVSELHRFEIAPVRVHDRLYWDALRLHHGILEGLRAAAQQVGCNAIASVAIDGWGVDFGLLDRSGRLVQNPVSYRDQRTAAAMHQVHQRVSPRELYERTGTQMMPINTIYQLWAMAAARDPALEAADALLLMPDLFRYWLSGVRGCELTGVTTTQCYDPRVGEWAWDLLSRLDVPTHLFGEVVLSGTVLGSLRSEVAEETGLAGASVIAPAAHDTASAVAAVSFRNPGAAYISSGTWSLVGIEVDAPVINEHTFTADLTNEAGARGTFLLMRNVMGLWLLEECRRAWALEGQVWGFPELISLAEAARPHTAFVDPNDPVFLGPGNMPARICEWCRRTGQVVPEKPSAVVRCILESLALKYRQIIELLPMTSGVSPREIHVVGGGARNRLLCQWTADASGLPVWAGPAEASEVGNLVVQLIALGELGSLEDARAVVRESFPPDLYAPRERGAWDQAYVHFLELAAKVNQSEP